MGTQPLKSSALLRCWEALPSKQEPPQNTPGAEAELEAEHPSIPGGKGQEILFRLDELVDTLEHRSLISEMD